MLLIFSSVPDKVLPYNVSPMLRKLLSFPLLFQGVVLPDYAFRSGLHSDCITPI